MDLVVNGRSVQQASVGSSPLKALDNILYQVFGHRIGSYTIEGPNPEDPEGTPMQHKITVSVTNKYWGNSTLDFNLERHKFLEGVLYAYLDALNKLERDTGPS